MAARSPIPWGRVSGQALLAGVTGAIAFDLYLWLTTVLPQHASMVALWQFVASTVVGKTAFSSSGFAWLGVVIHLLVSMVWAAGYAYLAAQQPALNRHWLPSGLLYGVVVYVVMQIILLAGNDFTPPPNPNAFINAVIAHACFFGLPVAYVVGATQVRGELEAR
jgi:hypothetical protein